MFNLKYKLVCKSFHFKFLVYGVLNFIKILKKEFQFHRIKLNFCLLKIKKFTVLRSPFVNKKSREQFKVEKFKLSFSFKLFFYDFSLQSILGILYLKKKLNGLFSSSFVDFHVCRIYIK